MACRDDFVSVGRAPQHNKACPDNLFPVDEVEAVYIGKTPYTRFDMNDYSVTHDQVRKTLTIHATLDVVSILDGTTVLAKHSRSYDKAKQIECAEHIETLINQPEPMEEK